MRKYIEYEGSNTFIGGKKAKIFDRYSSMEFFPQMNVNSGKLGDF